jgi:hypothetical protein
VIPYCPPYNLPLSILQMTCVHIVPWQ